VNLKRFTGTPEELDCNQAVAARTVLPITPGGYWSFGEMETRSKFGVNETEFSAGV
jgi:hypothetical protein